MHSSQRVNRKKVDYLDMFKSEVQHKSARSAQEIQWVPDIRFKSSEIEKESCSKGRLFNSEAKVIEPDDDEKKLFDMINISGESSKSKQFLDQRNKKRTLTIDEIEFAAGLN